MAALIRWVFLCAGLLACAVSAVASPAAAQHAPGRPIVVEADTAELVNLSSPARSVIVANPAIADVQVPDPMSFVVLAKKPGTTDVFVAPESGRPVKYTITVERSVAHIEAALKRTVPDAPLRVAGGPNGIAVTGTVATPADAHRLRQAAHQFLGDKESLAFNVAVRGSTQVNLRVRVAEVSREVNKEFGFNWSALYNNGTVAVGLLTGLAPTLGGFGQFARSADGLSSVGAGYRSGSGSVNVSALINALVQEGMITVLAEPNLTAVSGEAANFLAGGEFPIPIAQGNGQISIEFKRFGVAVDFTPTVLSPNQLSIKVRSEVSELTDRGAVVIDNVRVPGLAVRRAQTTVELGSGQSFAIAGLFQNNVTSQLESLPWLGDVPVLGALFRSDKFKRNESELVIIVTPYIVKPAAESASLHLPTDGLTFADDLERLLLGQVTTKDGGRAETQAVPMPKLYGPAGFMLE